MRQGIIRTNDDLLYWRIYVLLGLKELTSGPWSNINMLSYQWWKINCRDKTVLRSSYRHNGNSRTGETASWYWISPMEHWKLRVVIMPTLSSLVSPQVVVTILRHSDDEVGMSILLSAVFYENMFWLAFCKHDDVIKWKHFPRNWPFVRGIHRSPVNSPHKGQWRGALMFSLICVWINDWVNNREAGD